MNDKIIKKLKRLRVEELILGADIYRYYEILKLIDTFKTLDKQQNGNDFIADVGGSVIKPPLGLIPKKFHDERVKVERFNEVCGAIARYYDAGLKINIEWIEEYNDLVDTLKTETL